MMVAHAFVYEAWLRTFFLVFLLLLLLLLCLLAFLLGLLVALFALALGPLLIRVRAQRRRGITTRRLALQGFVRTCENCRCQPCGVWRARAVRSKKRPPHIGT